MLDDIIKRHLKNIFGEEALFDKFEDRICYSFDATNLEFIPDAVVFPTKSEQISELLKIANENLIPVTPRGAGTGYSGGSLPVRGGIVLCLSRMDRIIGIDTENLYAVVEPGVITGVLQKEVERHGLFYPPDPSSLNVCTIGGNVAENAGGPRAVKYGVTRDYVMALEVVLPTGEIINTGVKTKKGVVGYDLTQLLVGSEGTLGVITRIYLRLIPQPKARKTMAALFPNPESAGSAVNKIFSSRIIPSALEFMDDVCMGVVERYLGERIWGESGCMLLIEADGMIDAVKWESEEIERVCRMCGAIGFRKADDKKDEELIWKARRSLSPALYRVNPEKINEDVVVPRSELPLALKKFSEIGKKYRLFMANFSHAGDGNIHVNIMISGKDDDERKRAYKAVEEIFDITIQLGGTISGEHGVGVTKAPFLGKELTEGHIRLMKAIKSFFDPKGVLNPGKIFPDSCPDFLSHLQRG